MSVWTLPDGNSRGMWFIPCSCSTYFSILTYRCLSPYQMPFIFSFPAWSGAGLSFSPLSACFLLPLPLPSLSSLSQCFSMPIYYLSFLLISLFSHSHVFFPTCLLSIFLPYLSFLSFFSHYFLCSPHLLPNFLTFLLHFSPIFSKSFLLLSFS